MQATISHSGMRNLPPAWRRHQGWVGKESPPDAARQLGRGLQLHPLWCLAVVAMVTHVVSWSQPLWHSARASQSAMNPLPVRVERGVSAWQIPLGMPAALGLMALCRDGGSRSVYVRQLVSAQKKRTKVGLRQAPYSSFPLAASVLELCIRRAEMRGSFRLPSPGSPSTSGLLKDTRG